MADEAPPTDAPQPAVSNGVTRHRQASLLRELATRLEDGEAPLPTDVFGAVLRELEQRRDDDAIAEAYAEQDGRKGVPWALCRGRAQV